MEGDHLPSEDHISRYVGGSKMIGNRVSGQAFALRSGEKSLSVNWLEFFQEAKSQEEQIHKVRETFEQKSFSLGKTARFVVFNNKEVCSHVLKESPALSAITIKHDPLDDDPSHSGIFDITIDDMPIVAELIAGIVTEDRLYPGKIS